MSMESVGCVTKSRPDVLVSVLGASAMHRKRIGNALRRDCTDRGVPPVTSAYVRLRPSTYICEDSSNTRSMSERKRGRAVANACHQVTNDVTR